MNFFKRNTFYIIIYSNKLEVRHIEGKNSIIRSAKINFSHRRSVIDNYEEFELLLKGIIRELIDKKREGPHKFILQVREETMNDLTKVEKRALRDSAEHAGAIWIMIYEGNSVLSDFEILELIRNNHNKK